MNDTCAPEKGWFICMHVCVHICKYVYVCVYVPVHVYVYMYMCKRNVINTFG